MICETFLPHSYAGRGPAESCVQVHQAFAQMGISPRLHVIRTRKDIAPSIAVKSALGPMGHALPYRYVKKAGYQKLVQQYVRAIERAEPGSIAYIWPDAPLELVVKAKRRGLIVVREMINSPLATAKPILDAAYRDAGLAPNHSITDEMVEDENRQLEVFDFIFSSNAEVDQALLDLGIPADRIMSTSFGYTASRFAGVEPTGSEPSGPFRFCFVGTLNIRKGVNILLDAWDEADIDGELWFAGAIQSEIAERLQRSIDGGNVRHLGHVDDIAKVYAQCDGFVFPTLEEGGPQVTYEAAACGLPCITTPMGAARLVADGRTGTVVPSGDRLALAQAMSDFAADRGLSRQMGLHAKDAAVRFEYANVSRQRGRLLAEAAGS